MDASHPVVFFVAVVVGLPAGFLAGWRAGWKEHLVRAAEDRKAGRCAECLRPLPPSQNRHDSVT